MNAALWAANLAVYSLQAGIITVLAAVLLRALRVRSTQGTLVYLQALLGACLLLPAVEPCRVAPDAEQVSVGNASAGRISAAGVAHPSVFTVLIAVVAVGIAARLIWLGIGYARLGWCRRRARPVDAHHAEMDRLQTALGVRPRVYVSSEVPGPVTFGCLRPAILLPSRWLELDRVSRDSIACHEFLHVRRNDWAFHAAEEIVRALLWFHPAIWWLIAEIRLAREEVIDRMVVRITGAPRPYVEALLAFAGVASPMAVAPAFARRRHLARRISSILQEVSMTKSRFIASLASVTLCVVAAGTFAIRLFPLHAPLVAHAAAAQQERKVYKIGEGVTSPRVVSKVDPQYTKAARKAKIEGTVVVRLEVHPDGRAHSMHVARSLDPGLDRKALEAISRWTFAPATKDGAPVAVAATIEVNFRLL
jgi:TonB family protein